MNISRRDFLKVSLLSTSYLVVSTGLSGCSESTNSAKISFNHGIASGDPLSDRVIIWTRVTPNNSEEKIELNFEVATDEIFNNITNRGLLIASKEQDFTLKVDVQNLNPATKYYYRFYSQEIYSPVGVAKTLSLETPTSVKMAVFSCANYTNGYFNVYQEACKVEELDVTIHLGDYIYEYGMYEDDDLDAKIPAYATEKAVEIGRELPKNNDKELFSLEDYRRRYALYHTDEGLQSIHAKCPMIVVWDDHEIADDSYRDGALNHDDTEGDFHLRTLYALQAYFEWLPIRPIENKKEIYRSFEFGDLVSLHMLETRIFSRDKQLNYDDYRDESYKIDSELFEKDVKDSSRKIVGPEQLSWLKNQLESSNATWQVLGQQVLMGKMYLPSEIVSLLSMLDNPEKYGKIKKFLLLEIYYLTLKFVDLKKRFLLHDDTLSDEELRRLNDVLPFNLDAWDGYFMDREKIFNYIQELNQNFIVLAGDSHNAWATNLKDQNQNQIGVEFAVSSVSSPGLEDEVDADDSETILQIEEVLLLLIDDLEYVNGKDRGFMTLEFTQDKVDVKWLFVNNYDSKEYSLLSEREKNIRVQKSGEALEIFPLDK